jgi:uncharacterized coiled-coil protein SlyX
MSINIETDLKEILTKIDNRLDNLQKDMTDVKVSVAEQKKDIQRLEEKIDGLGKRLDNVEFINRGVFVGLLVVILGGAAKLFGFAGNS